MSTEDLKPEKLATFKVEREEVGKITLCGSTRFRAEYELWNKRLTLAGFLVYSVSGFGHSGDSFTEEEKAQLDRIHLAKIDASHAIVVINPGGYIGDSTRREIAHAESRGKAVYFTDDGRTVYQLRTGPDGHTAMRYRAFDYAARAEGPVLNDEPDPVFDALWELVAALANEGVKDRRLRTQVAFEIAHKAALDRRRALYTRKEASE